MKDTKCTFCYGRGLRLKGTTSADRVECDKCNGTGIASKKLTPNKKRNYNRHPYYRKNDGMELLEKLKDII